jgi:hypothetical protein
MQGIQAVICINGFAVIILMIYIQPTIGLPLDHSVPLVVVLLQLIYQLQIAGRLVLGPILPTIQWIHETLYLGGESGQNVKLIIHVHLLLGMMLPLPPCFHSMMFKGHLFVVNALIMD